MRENTKGWLLNGVGFRLRALGRLAEAAQPMQAALQVSSGQKNWDEAARHASNLSELTLTIGDVKGALAYAEQGVQLADNSGDRFIQMQRQATLANALHHVGRLAESQFAFHEAEETQKKNQPEFPLLYSLRGFQYCDLLLSQGNYAEVERRASQTLELAKQYLGKGLGLLDIGNDYLSLGRAHFLRSQREPNHPFTESLTYLNRAVDGLRQAGQQDKLPLGLLARAEYHRVTGDLKKAQKDVEEAFSIATRGGMGLYLADCHLGFARLNVERLKVEGSKAETDYLGEAKEHLATAKEMIAKMGYHRRDKEVEELEEQLK